MFSTLLRDAVSSLLKSSYAVNKRLFFKSNQNFIKEIVENKVNNKLVVEGKIVVPPWKPYELKSAAENKSACSVCSTDLEIKHTDVLILRQFVRSDGCMLPRRVTGLCKLQQKRIASMVAMAQKAGLMANVAPLNSKKDPKLRPKWKKCNTYFDESTIRPPKEYRKKDPIIKLI
uniref:Putative mitochondrial ribosomal protein s18a n=2 Tax=Rhodnius TaxID=13248 RepID=R4FJS4_RHOPR